MVTRVCLSAVRECGISILSQTRWRGFVCLQFVKVAFQDLARRGDTGLSTIRVCLQFVNVAFPDLARSGDASLSVCSL